MTSPKNKTHLPGKIELKDSGGKKFEVPAEGSLGLLALGAVGLIAWREKKKEIVRNK